MSDNLGKSLPDFSEEVAASASDTGKFYTIFASVGPVGMGEVYGPSVYDTLEEAEKNACTMAGAMRGCKILILEGTPVAAFQSPEVSVNRVAV